ncbi:MAG TPA: cytochrome c [Gaiellaceae bacterium]|nr:cytochrome c [Gaiellaceae bacterium]
MAIALAAALAVSLAATASGAAPGPTASAQKADLAAGRALYRRFCGQCHALSAALSAGFGSRRGLGELGGPSFNELRVPYAVSITAVTLPTGGHEVVKRRITARQLHAVARYIARVTRKHPVPAFSTDG